MNCVERLVTLFGSQAEVARRFRLDRAVVNHWVKSGYVPARWAMEVERATNGQIPAVDVLASVSRCMSDVTSVTHREIAATVRDVLSAYREASDLIEVGAYQSGTNPRVDRAIQVIGTVNAFLKQSPGEHFGLEQSLANVKTALMPPPPVARREQNRG
jgi:DNA-binding transcriptional regulator YdaS (Cro superfamily)